MFRDILVPLDGSRFAEAALPLASRLVRAAKARLHLVLAQEPREAVIGAGEMVLVPTNLYEERKAQARSYLTRTVAKLRPGEAGAAEFHQVEGPAGPAICEEATRLDADLVVMATHGRGSFRRFWLGSVADYVIRHLATPVLLVHPGAPKAPARTRPLRSIAVALDLSRDAEAILEPVTALAQTTGAALTLVHVAELIFQIGSPGIPGPILADAELLEASRIEAQDRLDRIAARLRRRGLKVTTRVITGASAASGLLEVLEQEEFDLIAMTTHGHGGVRRLLLGGVADKVIRGATKPVLVLRPQPAVA